MRVLLLLALMVAGLFAGRLQRRAATSLAFPGVAASMLVLVAVGLALQLHYPALLERFARDPALWTEGQVWRAVTALFVQDGGLVGGLFNLALLLAIGPLAESRLGHVRWLCAYFAGGILTEFIALAWQPHGAGNSIACLALAGALVAQAVGQRRRGPPLAVAIVAGASALALLAARDIHGVGFLAGALVGMLFALRDRAAAQNTGS